MRASEIRALFAVASRPEIVSLAGGMPFTAALDYDAVGDVTAEVIRDHGPAALQYGGGQGLPGLRERLVQVMAAESVPAHPDDLVVTTGGQQGLDLVAKLFCDPADVILAEGPSYVGALGAFAAYEADVVHVPMDAQGLIPEALAERLDELAAEGRRAKFLYTVPNHQNPAGVSLTAARRTAVLELAERHDLLIVEDNPYGLLDFKGEVRPPLRALAPERVLYVGTLSKIFSPGIRVGWVAAPESIREKLVLLKEAADLCQSNLTQYLAERWLASQPWLRQVEQYRQVYRERCEALVTELRAELPSSCSWSEPTGGFFVWLRLPRGLDSGELLAKAISARVAYVPGRAFYADGSGGDELRLSFCFPTPDKIREGVRRLAQVLHTEVELVRAMFGERA
ncbi:MAG: aminotransferase class I/II-fold pyridoxal phosphate-dependent enzyme [Nitriliruptorales bacterium]|nr:aminotransferase class I/II-fold pyridoxal phosphate-dependent enzyme [Nitriliruptorales bacterium]